MLKIDKIDPTEVRARLAVVCATYAEPTVAFPVPMKAQECAQLLGLTDAEIWQELERPYGTGIIPMFAERFGLPLEWLFFGDISPMVFYARIGLAPRNPAG